MQAKIVKVFFFTGSHIQKIESALHGWVTQFEEKHGEYNLTVFDTEAETCTLRELSNAIFSPPFLGEKRLVIIKNFPFRAEKKLTQAKEEMEKGILEVMGNFPDSTLLLFFSPNADMRRKAAKEVEKCAEIKKIDWNETTKEELIYAKVGKVTNVALRQFLFHYIGNDPLRISAELDKLATFADGKQLTQEDVEHCVVPELEESVFNLLDAVAGQNAKKALFLLERLFLSGQDIFAAINMLIWQFEHLFYVKELSLAKKSDADILRITGLKPYPLQKNKQLLSKYSLDTLKKAMKLLYDFDVRIKTGIIKTTQDEAEGFEGAVKELVLSLALLS